MKNITYIKDNKWNTFVEKYSSGFFSNVPLWQNSSEENSQQPRIAIDKDEHSHVVLGRMSSYGAVNNLKYDILYSNNTNGTFSTPVPIYSRIFPNSLWYFSVEDINIEKDSSVSCVFVGYSIGYKPTIYYAWIKNGNLLNVVDLDNVINFRSFFQYNDYMIPFARIVTDSTKLYIAFQIQRPGSDWTIYLSCIDRQSLYTNQRNTYYSYPRRNFMAYSNHKGEIVLSLQKDMLVIVSLYDIQGERIATISNSVLRSGKHYLALNREKICSGMYIVKVSTRDGDIMLREKIIK